MNAVSCFLINLDASEQSAVTPRLKSVFPGATITAVANLSEACKKPTTNQIEIAILSNPDAATLAEAQAVTDHGGLARWAIVVLGTSPDKEHWHVIADRECEPELFGQVFRAAVALHESSRENTRLKGDLQTIGTRFAHDLRTPLGGIIFSTEVIKTLFSEDHPDIAGLTKAILDSADELSQLLTRTTHFVRGANSPFKKETVAMFEVVLGAINRLQMRVAARQVNITQAETWPEVRGVASLLEIIWINLISNALDHSKDPLHIELGWQKDEAEFRFWVNDNGGGVPASKNASLFLAFNHLHHIDSEQGLGLSIVRRLVELHHGRYGHAPLPSGGSSFFFTLPITSKPNHH